MIDNFRFDHFSEKRKQEEEQPKDGSSSPKRSKRLSPSPSSSSSSASGESDNEKPVSAFYQSLLESSYAADGEEEALSVNTLCIVLTHTTISFPGLGQMSEREMMKKAFIQSIHDVAKSRIGKNNTDDEYDSP
jgi:OTU domain-containing protein 5